MADRKLIVLENGRITARGMPFADGWHYLWMHEDDVLKVTVDWSDWLGTDTISTSTFTSDGTASVNTSSNTTTEATVTLAGEDGLSEIENKITTANGLTKVLRFRTRNREKAVEDYPTR